MTESPFVVISLTVIQSRIRHLPQILAAIIKVTKYPNYVIHIFYSEDAHNFDKGCKEQDIRPLYEFAREQDMVDIRVSKTGNIGSLRKIVPALQLYQNCFILTVDDDEVFESDIVSEFMMAYNRSCGIVCSAAKIIDFTNWVHMTDTSEYYTTVFSTHDKAFTCLMPEGYGGVLYHTSMFQSGFLDIPFQDLPMNILSNDDIFLRAYTFSQGIPVTVCPIYQSCIYNKDHIDTLFRKNHDVKICDIIGSALSYMNPQKEDPIDDHGCREVPILLRLTKQQEFYKRSVHTGSDVKKLQYRIHKNADTSPVSFESIMRSAFFPKSDVHAYEHDHTHVTLINLEKDEKRYTSSICEFKKLLVTRFIHIKATFWKDRESFVRDMNDILVFLRGFSDSIPSHKVDLNVFSEFRDGGIVIQDGPLACYCSHVRALIYGYLHFHDYTVIIEDDFHVQDTAIITRCIRETPDDWDMICFGAQPINKFYTGNVYKMTSLFHSTHFYVVKNRSMPKIFQRLYPIDDQIDILYARMHPFLNIYNIPLSVCQKNFSSNTQNNMYVIFHSPNYEFIRRSLENIEKLLNVLFFEKHGVIPPKPIIKKIVFDIILRYIRGDDSVPHESQQKPSSFTDYETYFLRNTPEKLHHEIFIVIDSCLKGINSESITSCIIDDIHVIFNGFSLCGIMDPVFLDTCVPLNFGSTCSTYTIGESIVLKVFHEALRWTSAVHADPSILFQKECKMYTRLLGNPLFPKLMHAGSKEIYIEYTGPTLFDRFVLPSDWRLQMGAIFTSLDEHNIFYPEFNLKNITVRDNQIFFIDYGLAESDSDKNNTANQECFEHLLETIEARFLTLSDDDERHVYYYNMLTNLRYDEKFYPNIL